MTTARRLLAARSATESTAGVGATLGDAALTDLVERHIQAAGAADPDEATALAARAAAASVVADATGALARLSAGASPSTLSDAEQVALEGIVQVLGRPAMHFDRGRVVMPPDDTGDNGRWRTVVATRRSDINAAAAKVGRVSLGDPDAGGQVLGTAWRLGADLVVTNRHVAAFFVRDATVPPSAWHVNGTLVTVDFAATRASDGPSRFAVTSLEYCAADEDVDLAILKLATSSKPLPGALQRDSTPEAAAEGAEVYAIGHPLLRAGTPASDSVFGRADGLKRWSPGLVTELPAGKRTLEHDCSTLGGNSGSCVLTMLGNAVVGLHVGGLGKVGEDRVRANQAIALSRLGEHRAATILKHGCIDG